MTQTPLFKKSRNQTQERRLNATLAELDAANRQDPNREVFDGQEYPKELLYSRRMTEQLADFDPEASELLQLAARAQHICRWKIARSDYPAGRAGYKRWRSELGLYHGRVAGEIMDRQGYGQADIDRVQRMLSKRGLKRDPEVQTLENVICLVFMRYYLADFAEKHPEPKLIDIIQKTWRKMSPQGQEAALQLPLDDPLKALVGKAINCA